MITSSLVAFFASKSSLDITVQTTDLGSGVTKMLFDKLFCEYDMLDIVEESCLLSESLTNKGL